MITQNGEKVLRQIARELTPEEIKSPKIGAILGKMTEAMDAAENGVAIAAPQIGESLRIFLVDGNVWKGETPVKKFEARSTKSETKIDKIEEKDKKTDKNIETMKEDQANKIKYPPVIFINPVIKKTSKKQQEFEEGCLSVDGIYGIINRSEKAAIEALDENGVKFSRGCSGLLAQIVQHEVDHLNGVLFIDKAKNLQKVKAEK